MAGSNPGSINNYQDSKNDPAYPLGLLPLELQSAYPDSAYASTEGTPPYSLQLTSEAVVTEGTEASQTDAHHPEQRVYGSGHDSGYASRNASLSPNYQNAPPTLMKKPNTKGFRSVLVQISKQAP
jgi:hypothetical protein